MTAIASEIERFNRLSSTWWDPVGPMRPLHVVNELRLGYVVEQIGLNFRLETTPLSLAGLSILDVGCGGGLLSEALARTGAHVVGVDASPGNVAAARLHAAAQDVRVDYRLGEPSAVLGRNEQFDVVLALEVIEHVSDVSAFLDTVARCVKPGGLLFISTIDRSWKSYLFAILGAEYVLRLLPQGTHHWRQFVRPSELVTEVARLGLKPADQKGMRYDPFKHKASWCTDMRVNYIFTFNRGTA